MTNQKLPLFLYYSNKYNYNKVPIQINIFIFSRNNYKNTNIKKINKLKLPKLTYVIA